MKSIKATQCLTPNTHMEEQHKCRIPLSIALLLVSVKLQCKYLLLHLLACLYSVTRITDGLTRHTLLALPWYFIQNFPSLFL